MTLFTKDTPLVGGIEGFDLREFQTLVEVPFDREWDRPIKLNEVAGLLFCPQTGNAINLADNPIPSIVYHPGRRKWIVWYTKLPDKHLGKTILHENEIDSIEVGGSECIVVSGGSGLRFLLPSNTEKIAVEDIVYPTAFSIRKGDTLKALPVFPVKKRFLDLIECENGISTPNHQREVISFTLPLFGGLRLKHVISIELCNDLLQEISRQDQKTDATELHMEVWPKVQLKNWRSHWIHIETDEYSSLEKLHFEVYTKDEKTGCFKIADDTRQLSDRSLANATEGAQDFYLHESRTIYSRNRPRLLYISSSNQQGEPIGRGSAFSVYPDEANFEPNNNYKPVMSVDFGTSRSALLLAQDRTLIPHNIDKSIYPCLHRSHTFASSTKNQDCLRFHIYDRPSNFYIPTTPFSKYKEPIEENLHRLSSLLFSSNMRIVRTETEKIQNDNHCNQWIPFLDYGIATFEQEKKCGVPERLRDEVRQVGGFKWLQHREIGPLRRRLFLQGLLTLAAAEVSSRWQADEASLVYTFPLAFSSEQKIALHKDFQDAARWVKDNLGVTINIVDNAVSESLAGRFAIPANAQQNDWWLTLDIGGGTLDIGLWHASNTSDPLASESVEFGANLIVHKIASHRNQDQNEQSQERQKVFSEIWRKGFEVYYNPPPTESEEQRFVRYYANAIIEYASRVVTGTIFVTEIPLDKLNIILLGSGWRSLEALVTPFSEQTLSSVGWRKYRDNLLGMLHKRCSVIMETNGKNFPLTPEQITIMDRLFQEEGAEKYAIAFGALNAAFQDNIPNVGDLTEGIIAPNGLAESDVDIQIPFYTPIHNPQFLLKVAEYGKVRPFSTYCKVLNDPPLLNRWHEEDMPWKELLNPNHSQHRWDEVNYAAHRQQSRNMTPDGFTPRHRTALSILYRVILSRYFDPSWANNPLH